MIVKPKYIQQTTYAGPSDQYPLDLSSSNHFRSAPGPAKPEITPPEVNTHFRKVREEKKLDSIKLDHSLVIPLNASKVSESSSECALVSEIDGEYLANQSQALGRPAFDM
ncbi:MAG: hypothetical protein V2I33_20105 [Kangiellaceae bacterium]|nr:hypothetical protein [Kangiellaceae bacterium]